MIYAVLGQKDEAFLWLESARREHAPWMAYVKAAPRFDTLRSDPRFYSMLQHEYSNLVSASLWSAMT
jgi:hypothetical protein